MEQLQQCVIVIQFPILPGCGSVTEIMSALSFGVDVVKLFPGSLLGPGFIKDVKGPIPHVELMPSGGVSLDNIDKWMKNGAFAVGIGSALTKGVTNGDYSSVQKVAREFMDKLASIRAEDKMKKVVTLGEIMLRLSAPNYQKIVQAQSFDAVYGGGEANVAISLAKFGLDSSFVTKVPDNAIGTSAEQQLNRFGVKTDHVSA